ncbi:iron ABC transporter substrate-binding protein [Cephaloticoccus primus]|uniref:Iron ABC transporter substrate-binding protein n=1 Tax=Cephaloticoccus primus TaxID=1548207 RepID=A0A139SL45_9BACT|nr:siderophore ABC transporter substrate-binding protein [Cephaloticoccus primus]KXU35286.1 iron ABC transporter substrate-binding protein [Cephaloticoccus primus]
MKKHPFLFACALAGLALFLAPFAQAQPIRITHAKGELVLPAVPKRVLVLDVPSLDNLDALGVEVAGVPDGNLVPYLAKYQAAKYAKIGSLFEPNYEAINAARPDLIIIGGRSSSKYKEVAAIAPTIDLSVDADNYIESAKANLATLGRIFGKERRAAELNTALDARLAALKGLAAGAGRTVIVTTNAGRIGAYGPRSRLGWLHSTVGFNTVMDNIDDRFHGGDIISFEFLMEKNPDWIFVISRDAAIGQRNAENAAEKVLDNELTHQTTAWKKQQIVYLDPPSAYIVGSGYQALSNLLGQVHDALVASKVGKK